MARVLIVEDDPSARMLVVMLLEKEGHVAVQTENGQEALGVLEQDTFDLIITDLFMPGVDGFELIKAIRETRSDQKIIAISGRDGATESGPNYLDFSHSLGADDVIAKPLDAVEFRLAVKRCLAF